MSSIRVYRLRQKAVAFAGAVLTCASAYRQAKKDVSAARLLRPKKEDAITMKKSTFAAIVIFLSAAVGALVAAYLYIQRREKELDEYEQLLFSEEFSDTVPAPKAEEESAEPEEEVPAPQAEAEKTQETDAE